jgi:hypothetical protein
LEDSNLPFSIVIFSIKNPRRGKVDKYFILLGSGFHLLRIRVFFLFFK